MQLHTKCRRNLVVVAHPDDEVLGCGGTIARLSREGLETYIAILGEGVTSRYTRRDDAGQSLLEALSTSSRQAAALLGAKDVFFGGLPDNRFDTVPLLEVVKVVEHLIVQLKPGAIYTHYGGDLNIDHAVVHRAVLTATRPMVGQPVQEIYAFEVPSATEWAFSRFEPPFRPNVFVDISETLESKVAGLACYETEVRPFPHPRSLEALHALARYRGSAVGCLAAEAFELVRAVRRLPERDCSSERR
jgi:LmbE family N-acetylglucosaminyl deacetylase